MDDNIDYDKLATLVAAKLRTGINAAVRGRDALDETWLAEYMKTWVVSHAGDIATNVCASYAFEQQFKVRLKQIINTIY